MWKENGTFQAGAAEEARRRSEKFGELREESCMLYMATATFWALDLIRDCDGMETSEVHGQCVNDLARISSSDQSVIDEL